MFTRIILQLMSGQVRRKRRTGRDHGLAFEVLENRTLLTAVPIAGGMSANDVGQTGHLQDDHRSPPAEVQTDDARGPSRDGDQGRGGNGATNGQRNGPLPRGSRSSVSGNNVPPSLFKVAPPPPRGGSTVAAPNSPPSPINADVFVASPIADPFFSASPVEFDTTPTTRPADLLDSGLQGNSFAASESAPAPNLSTTHVQSRVPVNSAGASIRQSEVSARLNAGDPSDIFATMSAMELLEDRLTVIDQIVEARRVESIDEPSTTDALFATSSRNDSLRTDSIQSEEARHFREGFVDIGESVEELLGGQSPTERAAEDSDDRRDFGHEDSTADATGSDGVSSVNPWQLVHGGRFGSQIARGTEAAIQEQEHPPATREGMVELAHSDSPADGLPNPSSAAKMLADGDATFLKMDGSVVRYQAFDIAPAPSPGGSEPISSDGSLPDEQSATGKKSVESSDQGNTAARASVGSALLAVLSRRRSRRRGTSTP